MEPRPKQYPTPMTPTDLALAVTDVVIRAQARVGPNSVGAQQYHTDGEPQRFETMPLLDLIDYSIEEALDHINYGVMLTIRLDRLRQRVEDLDWTVAGLEEGRSCNYCDGTGKVIL